MPAYTALLQKPLDTISWEDDNFIEELLEVVQLFRPFSKAMDGQLESSPNRKGKDRLREKALQYTFTRECYL